MADARPHSRRSRLIPRRAACWQRLRSLFNGPRTDRAPVSEREARSPRHPRFARQRFRP